MYVRARLEQAIREQAISVPQQAVARSADGASVMVVGADGKVAVRPVKTGGAQGNAWVINEGLQAGDQVIVEGLQKVKPGAAVKVVQWQPKAPSAANTADGASPSAQQNSAQKKDTPVVAPAAKAQ
jgi:membrane fusion protein (multidrug efflux system)